MKKYKDYRNSGRFVLSTGDEVHGELALGAGATSLDLYSREFFTTQTSRDIFGTFHDLSKVSLLHCITTQGLGTGTRGDDAITSEASFPTLFSLATSTSARMTARSPKSALR